jgi:hypothetical protein
MAKHGEAFQSSLAVCAAAIRRAEIDDGAADAAELAASVKEGWQALPGMADASTKLELCLFLAEDLEDQYRSFVRPAKEKYLGAKYHYTYACSMLASREAQGKHNAKTDAFRAQRDGHQAAGFSPKIRA